MKTTHSTEALLRRLRRDTRARKGHVEVEREAESIKALAAEGYSMQAIWRVLHEAGRMESSYRTFCRHASKHVRAAE